jgi:hypothetical protein
VSKSKEPPSEQSPIWLVREPDAKASLKVQPAYRRSYIHTTRASTWADQVDASNPQRGWDDEIMLFLEIPKSREQHVMTIRWQGFACLEIFEDAWKALALLPDLMTALASVSGKRIQPDDFRQLIEHLGFIDKTP